MGAPMYEQAMRQEARRLISEHGELVEVRCVSGPPDYRIELEFADGHQKVITRHSGQIDITMMKFGYSGTGTDCFWAFLNEAGFKDVSLEQLQTMKGAQVLRKGEPLEESGKREQRTDQELTEASGEETELPSWDELSRDPSLMDPLILEQLQKSICFMVRDETGPVAALVIRASPDEFRGAITAEIPMSLYVHHYKAPTFDLYGGYPIIWDDPKEPFFKETWLVGAGTVTGPPDPVSEGQLARLESLLTQEYTYFLVVDPSDNVVASRRVNYSPATQEHFVSILPGVRAARSVTISNADLISGVGEYMNRVSLEEVRSAASRLRAAEPEPQEEGTTRAVPTEAEEERVYPWRGKSKLSRLGLALGAIVQFFLCSGIAGYVMSGFDPGLFVYLLVLFCVLAISAQTMFQALRPTTLRELVISSSRGLIFRRKSGKEKPVMARINRVVETQRGKVILIHGHSPEEKYVRAQIGKANLPHGNFRRFKEDLERLIPGVKIEVPTRGPLVRRLLAGVCSMLAVVALGGFLLFTGATVYDYVKGIEFERIPLETQLLILLALFAAFVLFAGLSTFLTDRRRVAITLWSVFLVLGLIGTGGIVAYLLRGEGVGRELPALAPLDLPITRASPTPIPTPGSPGADQIIAYNPGLAQNEDYASPQAALGAPDLVEQPCCSGMLQLGAGGSLLLAFTDNTISDGPGPDFQVFGESARDDFIIVEVSADGQVWRAYPKTDESPEPFDLADVGLDQVPFVRVTDVQPGTPTGAELDAVEAIHNGPPLDSGLLTDLPDAIARADATLREGPGSRYDAVGQVSDGTILAVEGCNPDGTWAQVQTTDGQTAWCNTTQVALNVSLSDYEAPEIPATPTPPEPTPAPLA
ncbi:MAG: SH3 domain-containing protein, partial [Anaerolineae bacterium]